MRRMVRHVPWALVLLRAAAAVALGVGLFAGGLTDGRVMALFAIAFASDYFDGVVARACGVATRGLRQGDSIVDTAFYLVLGAVTLRLHREVVQRHATALAICLGTLGVWAVLDVVRWRAAAGFHSWSAKLFAAALGDLGGGALRLRRRRALAGGGLRRRNVLPPRGDRDQLHAARAPDRRSDLVRTRFACGVARRPPA